VSGYEFESREITAFVYVQDIGSGYFIPVSEAVYGRLNKGESIVLV
jgi:hypothetical protein